MIMVKFWHSEALRAYLIWRTRNKETFKKINELIKRIEFDGYNEISKVESFKHEFSSYWSVKINTNSKIIFCIADNKLRIIHCGLDDDLYSDLKASRVQRWSEMGLDETTAFTVFKTEIAVKNILRMRKVILDAEEGKLIEHEIVDLDD